MDIDILGISELKWTEMSEFNSDDSCIYSCGQECPDFIQMIIISTTVVKDPLEEIEWSSESTKESEMQYLGAISKVTD